MLHLIRPPPKDIAGYHKALVAADALRSDQYPVFTSQRTKVSGKNVLVSWVETVEAAAGLFQKARWDDLNAEEIAILLGLAHDGKDWGLLGDMGVAGQANQEFKTNSNVRQQIRDTLSFVLKAKDSDQFSRVAANVLGKIAAMDRFGPAIATRLITLARPEYGISVNNGSAPGLAELTGWRDKPHTLQHDRNYPKLLEWVFRQPWHDTPEPREQGLRRIWRMRAALLDVFVYEPPQRTL